MAIYEYDQERDESDDDEQIEPAQDTTNVLPVRAQDKPAKASARRQGSEPRKV